MRADSPGATAPAAKNRRQAATHDQGAGHGEGGNFGWNRKERTFCFDPNGDEGGFA